MKQLIALTAFLYSITPFKKQLLSCIRMCWIPAESISRHLHFRGIFRVRVNDEVSFKMKHYGTGFMMESDHFWRGASGSEPYSVHAWIDYAKKSDLIMDVGANTGSYSLIAAAVNPTAEVHAFEPVARICDKLRDNCLLNNFTIQVHNVAVSNESGYLYLVDQRRANEYTCFVLKHPEEDAYSVSSLRLDSFKEIFLKARSVLIKIDVEGHEAEVLAGMGDLLKRIRPVILLEVLTESVAEAMQKFFNGKEYIFLNIDEKKGYRLMRSIERSAGNNIFCCPKEKYNKMD